MYALNKFSVIENGSKYTVRLIINSLVDFLHTIKAKMSNDKLIMVVNDESKKPEKWTVWKDLIEQTNCYNL